LCPLVAMPLSSNRTWLRGGWSLKLLVGTLTTGRVTPLIQRVPFIQNLTITLKNKIALQIQELNLLLKTLYKQKMKNIRNDVIHIVNRGSRGKYPNLVRDKLLMEHHLSTNSMH